MEERYVFLTQWRDPLSGVVRRFQLSFFASEGAVELLELKTRKLFLRKTAVPRVLADFALGARVELLGRQIEIVAHADEATRKALERRLQRTFALVKPDAMAHWQNILSRAEQAGLTITRLHMLTLSPAEAGEFYAEHRERPFFAELVSHVSSAAVLGVELAGEEAVTTWRTLLGPTVPATARRESPQSLRALYGAEGCRNAAHGSDSADSARRELSFFATLESSVPLPDAPLVLLLLKPHLLRERRLGEAAEALWAGLAAAGLSARLVESFALSRAQAEEFLELYRDVLPDFAEMAVALAEGPLVAVAVEGAVAVARKLVGPLDPQLARAARPRSLRALFGSSRAHNAFHCTELAGDGALECEFFFALLRA